MTKCEGIAPCFELQTRSDRKTGSVVTRMAPLLRHLGGVKKAIATWIVQASEPKVSERRDRKGRLYYRVYDPVSNSSAAFGSESEIRAWLEQRYYR
jgi:hypothetical protein